MSTSNRNPYQVTTVRCAAPGCSNLRRQANHWFVAVEQEDAFFCRPYLHDAQIATTEKPVCGQACAQKIFERYLTKQTV
jgi:hypothetical protein